MKQSVYITFFTLGLTLIQCGLEGPSKSILRGNEAKELLRNSAYVIDVAYFQTLAERGSIKSSEIDSSLLLDQALLEASSKIVESKYYQKKDITACIQEMQLFTLGLISSAGQTNLLGGDCSGLENKGAYRIR
ncbi:TIGR04452 family lipoprotein [Leptospira sarikeiensis]|uniref:TIGR04452 family lipoprotein n=1 Tax=Leptospira sarikeiensis TaxID=2484943 RepID=UPI0014385697|nr:TIGR04452 family lipoprotein [Leptospira sarikeiensis]